MKNKSFRNFQKYVLKYKQQVWPDFKILYVDFLTRFSAYRKVHYKKYVVPFSKQYSKNKRG